MKKSNYILIAIATLAVASILTYFIAGRLHKGKNMSHQVERIEIPLPDFRVIAGGDSTVFHVFSGEQNRLSMMYVQDEHKSDEFYHISNDTLYIDQTQNAYSVNVSCKQDVISVIIQNGSRINIRNCKLNQLTVESSGGCYIDFHHNTFDTLRMQATDCAGIGLHNNHAEFISAELENTDDFSFSNNHFNRVNIEIKK